MKTGFLLGAGASADAGLPLARKLTGIILNDECGLLDASQSFLDCHVAPVTRDYSMAQSTLPFLRWLKARIELGSPGENHAANYEEVAYMADQIYGHLLGDFENPAISPLTNRAMLDLSFLLVSAPDHVSCQLERLTSNALEYIRRAVCDAVNRWPQPSELEYLRFLIKAPNEGALNVITLNNDTLVEQFLLNEGKNVVDGFEPALPGGSAKPRWNPRLFDEDSKPGTLRLFKLHGSVNWFRFRPNTGGGPDEFWRTAIDNIAREEFLKLPRENRPEGDLPEVLVGTFNKLHSYTNPLYLPLHYAFHRELETTDNLIVCGYSFGDKGINRHIVNWLNGHQSRRMVIVDACEGEEDFCKKARGAICLSWCKWKENGQLHPFFDNRGLKFVDWDRIWNALT